MRACCGEILWWVASCEVSQAVCERGWNMVEKLVVICGASRRFLKQFIVTVRDPEGVRVLQGKKKIIKQICKFNFKFEYVQGIYDWIMI